MTPEQAKAAASARLRLQKQQAPKPEFPERTLGSALMEGASTIPDTLASAAESTGDSLYEAAQDPMGPMVGLTKNAVKEAYDAIGSLGNLGAGALREGAKKVLPTSIFNMIEGVQSQSMQQGGEQASETAKGVGSALKRDYGSGQGLLNQIATRPIGAMTDLATLPMGGEALLLKAAKMAKKADTAAKLTKVANVTGKVGKYINPVSLVTEPTMSLMNRLDRRAARAAAAKPLGIGPKALENVSEAIGDVPQAEAALRDLGPSGAVFNTSPQAIQEARALAALPDTGAAGRSSLMGVAQKQVDEASKRFKTDWNTTMGPSLTEHGAKLAKEKTQQGVTNIYEAAKKAKVDVNPVIDTFIDAYGKNLNDIKGLATLNKQGKYLTNPINGKIIDSAEELLNLRKSIDEKISAIGKSQTNELGVNLFKQGSKTQQAKPLMEIRKTINETLHKDPNFAMADKTFGEAADVKAAYDYGYENIIGTGDKMPDPSRVKKYYDDLKTTEEKAAFTQGLSRRGELMHGDIKLSRNTGKSAADTIATENNLARIEAIGGTKASENLRSLASREDALAGASGKIIGGSDTARSIEAAKKHKIPEKLSVKNLTFGDIVGASPIAMYFNPGLIPYLAAGGAAAGGYNMLSRAKALKNLDQMARTMSKTGPEATGVLEAIKKLKDVPKPKSAKGLTQALTGAYQASKLNTKLNRGQE